MTQLELGYDSGPIRPTVNELAAEIGLDALAALVHETAKEKGFWPTKYYTSVDDYSEVPEATHNLFAEPNVVAQVTEEAIYTKLALVHSEVTEVLEAIRKDQGEDKVVEEMADILVRLLDLWAALKNTGQVERSLDEAIQTKMKVNEGRPKLHGNRF